MLTALAGNLFGERYGDGDVAVVALHGWGRSSRDFDRLLKETSLSGRASVAVDLPGFGATPLPPFAYSTRDYADALIPLLESFGGPVSLVGHSRGGAIAVCLAAKRPDLISGLVVTGAPLLRSAVKKKSAMRYRIIRQLSNWHLVSDRAMEAARSRYGSADYNAASGMLREILVTVVNETFEEELAAITCPVELVWGERDTAVPVEVAQQSLAKLSTATLTVLPGVDHDTVRHAPEALAEAFERLS